jgi:hypothetical protein
MKLRTIALAVALACGVTGVAEAKNKYKNHYKAKKYKKHKFKYNVKSH